MTRSLSCGIRTWEPGSYPSKSSPFEIKTIYLISSRPLPPFRPTPQLPTFPLALTRFQLHSARGCPLGWGCASCSNFGLWSNSGPGSGLDPDLDFSWGSSLVLPQTCHLELVQNMVQVLVVALIVAWTWVLKNNDTFPKKGRHKGRWQIGVCSWWTIDCQTLQVSWMCVNKFFKLQSSVFPLTLFCI